VRDRIFGVLMVLLLMATSLLCTQLGATELGDWPDAVWADWAQDTGPPVAVVSYDDNLIVMSTASAQDLSKYTNPLADVRSDNLESRSIVAYDVNTGSQKPTASLSDGTADGRMVTAWRVGLPVGGRTNTTT